MVIVGLVAAGVGLALDAYENRQLAKEQRRNASLQQQEQQLETGIISSDSVDRKRESEAFNELQKYAEYSNALSQKVLADIAQEDGSMGYNSPASSPYDTDALYPNQKYVQASTSRHSEHGVLSTPLVIPQYDMDDEVHGWPRAYAPSLMDCGIDQKTFLNFIDSFNESIRLSPRLEVVNIANVSITNLRGDSPQLFTTIPVAIQLAKSARRDPSTNSFLTQANDILFRARGLFAMIVTLLPASPSQISTINLNDNKSGRYPALSNQYSSVDNKSSPRQDSKLRQMSNFITDYSDRRPRFWQTTNSYSSSFDRFSSPPVPNISSDLRFQTGPLSSLASVIANRKTSLNIHKRRQRRDNSSRPSTRAGGLLGNVSAGRSMRGGKGGRNGSIGWAMEQFGPNGRDDTGSNADDNHQIQEGVLYLVVVNDLQEESKGIWSQQTPPHSASWAGEKWTNYTASQMQANQPSHNHHMETEQAAPPAYSPGASRKY